MIIPALFVDEEGPYKEDARFDAWGLTRDARTYTGRAPAVMHPPCARWTRLITCRPEMIEGQDGGCFHVALQVGRANGGVIEHPGYSYAWKWFNLPVPPEKGWSHPDQWGGRTCRVDQRNYGHQLHKPTWLYAVLPEYPVLNHKMATDGTKVSETSGGDRRRWLTPEPFKVLLYKMAVSCVGWSPIGLYRQETLGNGPNRGRAE